MKLAAVLGEGEASDGIFAVTSVNKVLFRATSRGLLRHNCVLLANHYNVDFACFLGILEGQSELTPVSISMCGDLPLGHTFFDFSDGELGHDFVACEALREMEQLDTLGENDDNPVAKDV